MVPKSTSAPEGERKTTVHSAARTRPKSKSVPKEATEQTHPKATPSLIRLTREHTQPMGGDSRAPRVRRGMTGHLQEEVVVKRSPHAPKSPKEAWRAILVKGQPISIEGQSTSNRPSSTHFVQLERPPLKQAPPRDRHTTSKDPNVAPPTMSAHPQDYQAKMKALCHPPIPRPVRPKAETHRGGRTKSQDKQSDNYHLATQLNHPNTSWKCPFCSIEQDTFLALKAHNNKHHGGQLFRFECSQCGFQADNPQLLRKHRTSAHEVNAVGADTPDDGAAATPADATGVHATNETGELLCPESLEEGLVVQKSKEADPPFGGNNGVSNDGHIEATTTTRGTRIFPSPPPDPGSQSWGAYPKWTPPLLLKPTPGNIDPEATFLGTTLAIWPEDEPQETAEAEVVPIKLEDDNSHVICPTCYDFIPRTQYPSHRRSKGCYPPTRPPESTDESSHEPCRRTSKGRNHFARCEVSSRRVHTRKIKWSHVAHPLMIQKVKRSEMQYWSTARDKMTAIYRAALRKPNVDGTYNVNGQVTSLQELKRQIWNLPRQLKINI